MARIPLVQETDPAASEDSKAFLAQTAKARGRMLNLYRALANRPEAGRALSELIRTVYRSGSTLPQKEAELAYLTATVVNDCYY
jgi:alkylhydroperoxidase family enzyme